MRDIVAAWDLHDPSLLDLSEVLLQAHARVMAERGPASPMAAVAIDAGPGLRVRLLRIPPALGSTDRRPTFTLQVGDQP